jgi:osmoprotectant transport system permease protein
VITTLATMLPLAQSHGGFVREPGQGSTTCVGKNTTICLSWAFDHIGDYVGDTLEHLGLVVASVALGFAVAFVLLLLSHRRRWLIPTFTGVTGVIYTIPSIALFLLLLPITGRGNTTAIIALSLYTLQIIYRNNVTGLANVPEAAKDAGRGMGMTDSQLLWKVELPLAVPEIIAGVRIATVSTVAIASLAVFAGAGGLGGPLYFAIQQGLFKTGIFIPVVILLAMAILLDLLLMLLQARLTRWRSPQAPGRGRGRQVRRRRLATARADPA